MISWLQTVTQKHNKVLFSLLLVVIIVSFVFVIGNTGQSFGTGQGPAQVTQKFYGFELGSRSRDAEMVATWTQASLTINGQSPSSGQFEEQIYSRMVALYMANQLNIPEPTESQLREYVKTKRAFTNPANGEFSTDQYTTFLDNLKTNPLITEDTITLVLAQDYRIDQVNAALGGPGYVFPYQAEEEIKRRNTTWSIDTAEFNMSQFTPDVSTEEEAINNYYEENKADYEIGEKVAISFVKFKSEDFAPELTEEPTDTDLQSTFTKNKHKYKKDDEAKTPKTFAEAKDEVIADWKQDKIKELGSTAAGEAANQLTIDLYNEVYEGKITKDSDALKSFLENRKLELIEVQPYNNSNPPITATGLPYQALQEAMGLDDAQFFSSAIELRNQTGAAVIFYNNKIPARIPPLDEVRDRVLEDFKESEKNRLFTEHVESLKEQISTAIEGEEEITFADKAKELEFAVNTYTDFKLTSPPEGLNNILLYQILDLEQGELSKVISINQGAAIVNVIKKEEPDLETQKEEVDEMVERLASYTATVSQRGVFAELIQTGLPKDEEEESGATEAEES